MVGEALVETGMRTQQSFPSSFVPFGITILHKKINKSITFYASLSVVNSLLQHTNYYIFKTTSSNGQMGKAAHRRLNNGAVHKKKVFEGVFRISTPKTMVFHNCLNKCLIKVSGDAIGDPG